MAIALAFRLAVWLVPRVVPPLEVALRYVQTHDPEQPLRISEKAKRLLSDPNTTDEELEQILGLENGYPVAVTTITGNFEVRRVQLEFSVTGAALIDEDVRVITFHHIKLSGGQPVLTWDAADFSALDTAYTTFWNNIKGWYHSQMIWSRIAFYKAGPNIVPPQPPVYTADKSVPGTATAVTLPPQVAVSVTEIAGQKRNWGRFYLPAPTTVGPGAANALTNAGRPPGPVLSSWADQVDALYETALAANLPHVVYRPLLAANRPTGSPPTSSNLPERPANAQTVDQIQIDDVYDVIRRRRWERPTVRVQRAIGSAQARTITANQSQDALQLDEDAYTDELGYPTEPVDDEAG